MRLCPCLTCFRDRYRYIKRFYSAPVAPIFCPFPVLTACTAAMPVAQAVPVQPPMNAAAVAVPMAAFAPTVNAVPSPSPAPFAASPPPPPPAVAGPEELSRLKTAYKEAKRRTEKDPSNKQLAAVYTKQRRLYKQASRSIAGSE